MRYTVGACVCSPGSREGFKLAKTEENDRSSTETSCLLALKSRWMNEMAAGKLGEL